MIYYGKISRLLAQNLNQPTNSFSTLSLLLLLLPSADNLNSSGKQKHEKLASMQRVRRCFLHLQMRHHQIWQKNKPLTFCMLGNLTCILLSDDFFSKLTFFQKIFQSPSLDPHQSQHFVRPDSSPNCLATVISRRNVLIPVSCKYYPEWQNCHIAADISFCHFVIIFETNN